jgi:hypothetical protein
MQTPKTGKRTPNDHSRIPEKLDSVFRRGVHWKQEHAMSIHVEIPEPLAEKVAQAAKSQGKSPEAVVLEAVATKLDPFARLNELMAPVYERMKELGISEDEAVEDFERIKHEMRRERAAAGK